MPDRSGIKIWMERQSCGEEQPAFVFYYHRTAPWDGMELLSKQEQPCLGNPSAEKTVANDLELGNSEVVPDGSS